VAAAVLVLLVLLVLLFCKLVCDPFFHPSCRPSRHL
jgi:hypothetical protein